MSVKALAGITILDLSAVLAGPFATQRLADFGANVIKVEHIDKGDVTRAWGPPFLKDQNGQETRESAYYLSCNRNKKSIAIDLSHPKGQVVIKFWRALAMYC